MLSSTEAAKEKFKLQNVFIRVDGEYAFRAGELFDSYEELLSRMERHTKESLVYYWRRDSRTVERAFTKTTRTISERLKYYFVRFACIYGGMKVQTKQQTRRASQPKRTDCPAHVLLRAAKCGQKLEVISVCNDHNHEISERASQMLPQNRRLQEEVREEVLEMLKLKMDRKKIIEYVRQRDNKKITPKDLFNLAARLKITDNTVDTNKRMKILQKINRYTSDKSIRVLISNELAACEPDQSVYFQLDNNDLVEYISPDHEFGVNETIIDSIVEARKREILTDTTNSWSAEDYIITTSGSESTVILNVPPDIDNEENEHADGVDDHTVIPVDNIIVDESDTVIEDPQSTIVVYGNYVSRDDELSQQYDDEKVESVSSSARLNSTNDNYCSVVLYETTTDEIMATDEDSPPIANICNSKQKRSRRHSNFSMIRTNIDSVAKRISRCRKCRTDSRLVRVQVDYFKAKRDKLLAETRLLNLKKTMLMKEIKRMKDEE